MPPVGQVANPAEGLKQERFLDFAGHHRAMDAGLLEDPNRAAQAADGSGRVIVAQVAQAFGGHARHADSDDRQPLVPCGFCEGDRKSPRPSQQSDPPPGFNPHVST